MSPEPTTASKLCSVCGIDCAGKPRMKDAQGRYVCQDCIDKAKQTKQALKAPPPGTAGATGALTNAAPGEEDNSFLLNLGTKESVGTQAAKACPECGRALSNSTVLCIGCGYNLVTGKRVPVKVVKSKAPSKKEGGESSRMGNFMENAPMLGGVVLVLHGLALGALFVDQTIALVFLLLCGLVALGVGIMTVVKAFMDGILWGIGVLLVPFVSLFYVYGKNESERLKWVFGCTVLGQIALGVGQVMLKTK